ncbi:MAG: peptide-methionine (S)-S-oxide reductase MsrA [Bacteroidota bacterium]
MKFFPVSILALVLMAATCSTQGQSSNDDKKVFAIATYLQENDKDYSKYAVATFAGGCFWCTEAAFERIEGVVDVLSGYSGGQKKNPTYREVASGMTSHAEAIQIYYDPNVVTFNTLLEVFFVAHDPTQLNRQGPDKGPQYRSEIFYHGEEQKAAVDAFIQKKQASKAFDQPIVTLVNAYKEFWVAEAYHQNYYELNPYQPYVRGVSRPKVEKVKKTFASILKEKYRK